MATELIGLRVSVLLNPPYSRKIEGRVSNVRNRQLFVEDVRFLDNGSTARYLVIPGQDIADLEVVSEQPLRLQIPAQTVHSQPATGRSNTPLAGITNSLNSAPPQAIKPQTFADPAILSYAKTPVPPAPQELAAPPLAKTLSNRGVVAPSAGTATQLSATLSKPFNNLNIGEKAYGVSATQLVADESDNGAKVEGDNDDGRPGRRRRRRAKRAALGAAALDDSSPELSRPTLAAKSAPTAPTAQTNQTGWRQTPILEEIPASKAPAAANRSTATKNKDTKPKKKRAFGVRMEDGFGTEDPTDIRALDDFDFVGNLSKFDKKAVFEQLKNEDTTADEDLLVSHNRVSRPGTFQGTKLHPFENVLPRQRQSSKDAYNSDEDYDTVDALGSKPPYRAASRSSSKRRLPVRNASKLSDSSFQPIESSRPQGRDSVVAGTGAGSSPRPTEKPSLRYVSGRVAPCVWPSDLGQAEELAYSEYLLTEDILAENAGRAIAELALSTISPDGRRFAPGNHNTRPVIVILVRDERAGARGLAAGRHLQSRGIRVIASAADRRLIKDLDGEGALHTQMDRLDGSLMSWEETSQYLKTLDAPPELIIDALSGIGDFMSDLMSGEEASHVKEVAFQMMAWANKSRASCLAIDCPFGVSAMNGSVQVHEGEPAEIRAKVIACCGAPVAGILAAMQIRHKQGSTDDWRICICDIGINPALKQVTKERMGRGQGRAIAFGPEWIVKVRFDPSDT